MSTTMQPSPTAISPAVLALIDGVREALSDVDGIDPESIDVHDLARRTVAEALVRAADAGTVTMDVAGEAEKIKLAGFDYNADPADDEDSFDLGALFSL